MRSNRTSTSRRWRFITEASTPTSRTERGARETSELQSKSVEDLLKSINTVPEDIRTAVRNNGGGHANHTMFWQVMGPNGRRAADRRHCRRDHLVFRRLRQVQGRMKKAGVGRFGSGWAWVIDQGGKLAIESSANQDSPLMEGKKASSASTSGNMPTT
jgi:Fe-Mn family superoxide dismutase